MIYLDNAASTAVHPEVVKEMLPYFDVQYGNPSSIHQFGRKAKNAVQKARKQVAALIGAEPNEITVYIRRATESNNTILDGCVKIPSETNLILNHIITSSIEHEAILQPCKRILKKHGMQDHVSYQLMNMGLVDPDYIANSINAHTVHC